MSVLDIKAKRTELLDKMDALVSAAAKAGRDLTAAEREQWSTLNGQVKSLDSLIAAREGSAAAVEVARKKVNTSPGADFGVAVRYLAAAKGNRKSAASLAERDGFSAVARGLSITDGAAGGYLVNESLQRDFIEALRPRNVFLSAGPRVVDMTQAPKVDVSRVTQGGTVGYLAGENEASRASLSPEFARVSLWQKKLAGSLPISNDLLRFSGIAEQLLTADMVSAISGAFDQAMLRGDGTAGQPRGLRYLVSAAHTHAMTGAPPDADTVLADLTQLESDLDEANVAAVRRSLVMSPRSFRYLRNLQTSGGNYVFPEMRDATPRLLTFSRVFTTKQIPDDLGAGEDESEILAVEFDQVLFGSGPMEISLDQFGGYTDENGVLHATVNGDLTVLNLLWLHDVALRVPEAVAVLTGVTWGAQA